MLDVKRLAEYLCAKYDGVIITVYSDRALIMFDTEAAYNNAVGDKALKGFLHGRAENSEDYVFLGVARTMLGLQCMLE
jgi:hypothetical protein